MFKLQAHKVWYVGLLLLCMDTMWSTEVTPMGAFLEVIGVETGVFQFCWAVDHDIVWNVNKGSCVFVSVQFFQASSQIIRVRASSMLSVYQDPLPWSTAVALPSSICFFSLSSSTIANNSTWFFLLVWFFPGYQRTLVHRKKNFRMF